MDTVTLPTRQFILGDKLPIGVRDIRSSADDDLTGTTGIVSVYDSGGTVLSGANAQDLTIEFTSRNTRIKASFELTTGASMIITATGTYRAVYKLAFPDGSVKNWQQTIEVKANPF